MATPRTVAIDGPAGAGKSTIGALVAERLGYTFLDTGAMYRAIALAALRRGIDSNDAKRLAALARQIRIAIGPPTVRDGRAYTVLLDGADVTWALRGDDVDGIVSQIARIPEKRSRQDLLTEILRRDELDSNRTVAPLKAASDAILVETDGLSVGEALDRVLQVTRS